VIVVNKIDIVGLDQIPEEAREAFEKFKQDGIDILPMSTLTEDGVMAVKTHVCLNYDTALFISNNISIGM
jgi:nucleolar GTP-binding protein